MQKQIKRDQETKCIKIVICNSLFLNFIVYFLYLKNRNHILNTYLNSYHHCHQPWLHLCVSDSASCVHFPKRLQSDWSDSPTLGQPSYSISDLSATWERTLSARRDTGCWWVNRACLILGWHFAYYQVWSHLVGAWRIRSLCLDFQSAQPKTQVFIVNSFK